MRAAALLVAALLALGGCGGGDDDDDQSSPAATQGTATTPAGSTSPDDGTPAQETTSRPSPQDRSVQRALTRQLREEAATRSRGEWTFADIDKVSVRTRQVAIATRLGLRGREQAGSICLAARRFFLAGGQGQTAADVLVTGRRQVPLVRC